MKFSTALMTALAWPALAVAADPPSLESCALIGQPQDRLACYDQLAGRAPPDAPAPSRLEPKPVTQGEPAPLGGSDSLMSKYWELDPEDKRGIFNFTGYRANYVLPGHWTDKINRSPGSPTQKTVELPNYKHVEAKFQLSLRTKVAQDFGLPNADLWLAFSQQALWQVWNGTDSKPFRNSDYEPEITYIVPTGKGLRALPFGWQWRYTQLTLAHQSNGQSDPLSRSWNRVYLGTGFERGPWALTVRAVQRLKEDYATDNNPDLQRYRGRTDVQLNWAEGRSTASLLYRGNIGQQRLGSWQFDWSYPILGDQPNGMRWYVQLFSGFAETLTDYNFRQTSIGAGVSFLQF